MTQIQTCQIVSIYQWRAYKIYTLQPIYKKIKFQSHQALSKKNIIKCFYLIFQTRLGCNGMALSHIWINQICPKQAYPFQLDKSLVHFRLAFHRIHSHPNVRVMDFQLVDLLVSRTQKMFITMFSYMLVDKVLGFNPIRSKLVWY